jgi:arylsulfatase A-like enzyme
MFGFRLEPSAETLAQVLKRSGYRTAAFIGSHALGTQYDLHKGFDVYDEHFEQSRGTSWVLGHRRAATEVTQRALEWLEAADSRPFFLFLHYFDAHGAPPCTGPQGGEVEDVPTLAAEGPVRGLPSRRKLRRRLKRRWRARSTRSGYGERYHLARVREIDANLGKLVGLLRQRRAYDHTSIFIVSDHGDAFGEHGETGHREFLYDTTLRVPLIVKCPLSVPGTVEESLVRVIDIFPTVLAVLGVHTPDVDGTCLFPPSAGLAQKQLRAYSETRFQLSPDAPLELDSSLDSLRTSRWKLIRDHLAGSAMLFDLCADPGERKDVKSRYPEVARRLHAELEQLTRDAGPAEPTPSSSAERAQIKELLKSLGYL